MCSFGKIIVILLELQLLNEEFNLRSDRLDSIEKYILEHQTVTIEQLCKVFHVSINTIRRDLTELEKRGYVSKVYGGVAALRPADYIPEPMRTSRNKEAKELIGKLAAKLVENGDTVFIDSGTTAINIVPNLTDKKNITIISHSMTVLALVTKYIEFNVMGVGGQYNPDTSSFFGPETIDALEGFNITKAFIGCSGLTAQSGLTNMTYYEPILKNKVIERSEKMILVTDVSKMGYNATRRVCPLNAMQVIVSDKKPPKDIEDYCNQYGIEMIYK